jgi:hypothetical protein
MSSGYVALCVMSVSRYSSCIWGICDVDSGFKYEMFLLYLLICMFNTVKQ